MGGTSTQAQQGGQTQTQNQTQNQTQQLTPYAASQPGLSSILGNLSGINPNLSQSQTAAIAALTNQGATGNPFAPSYSNVANSLLAGGGATDQAGNINAGYQRYANQIQPFTNPAFLDPRNTPGFGDALSALNSDITGQINSQFAGAGRDLSGMNTQTLARGLAQGEGGLIANQYNANVGNQLGAINSLYNASNTNAGILSGLQQQAVQNQQAGFGAGNAAFDATSAGPLLQLQAQSYITGIPLQTLAAQAGIVLPTAQAFGTQTGTGINTGTGTGLSNQSGTNQASGAQQFGTIAQGIGGLFPKVSLNY